MNVPERLDLPFFAYGVFCPGQLAFHRLKAIVEEARDATVTGDLRIRDGLPILDAEGHGKVSGSLLSFRPASAAEAYRAIVELEPDRQYRWAERVIAGTPANILLGRSPLKGSALVDEHAWDGRKDPLFTAALDVVRETLASNAKFEWDLRPMFRLQMAYLLLWSSIERYLALRYHLGSAVMCKIRNLATEPAFREALASAKPEPREIYRADKPNERIRLDPTNPESCVEYYYQVRSNAVHRGKAVVTDHEIVQQSLTELITIFDHVRERAFAGAMP